MFDIYDSLPCLWLLVHVCYCCSEYSALPLFACAHTPQEHTAFACGASPIKTLTKRSLRLCARLQMPRCCARKRQKHFVLKSVLALARVRNASSCLERRFCAEGALQANERGKAELKAKEHVCVSCHKVFVPPAAVCRDSKFTSSFQLVSPS